MCEKVDSLYSSILFFPLGSFCFVSMNAHLPMMSEYCSQLFHCSSQGLLVGATPVVALIRACGLEHFLGFCLTLRSDFTPAWDGNTQRWQKVTFLSEM